jgi:hypothetical protein
MKLKFVGEADHIVCFVGKTYVLFEKGEVVEVPDADGMNILAKHHGKFEKQEEAKPKVSRAKVMAEVIVDEPSK